MPRHVGEGEAVLSVRLPGNLARQAREIAEARDETLSQVVRRAVRSYIEKHASAQGDLISHLDAVRRGARRKRS
jgi:predicted transcriptional regulator